jgi:hypothetical protein
MNRCENTVRKYMRELLRANLVEQTRRGQRKSNLYRLVHTYPIGIGQKEVPEPQLLMPNKTVLKPRKEEFDSCPQFVDMSDNSDSTPSMYIADSTLPKEEKIVCPAPIARLADDVGKEMRDKAPLSTRTRIARIHQKSGLSVNEFMTEALAARAITRNRLGRILRRAKSGQAQPMAYFLSVLENRLNLGEKTQQKALQPLQNLDVKVSPLPPILIDSRPSGEARVAFWTSIREVFPDISDLKSYCHAAGRPPVYDDLRRSIQIVSGRDKR